MPMHSSEVFMLQNRLSSMLTPRKRKSATLSTQVPPMVSGSLVLPGDEPHHCSVVCKLHDGVVLVDRGAVVRVETVEQWAEHTALGGASSDAHGWRCVLAHPHCLSAVREEAVDPHAGCRRQSQVP
ncbi:unnamed protein product [Tetraodon nigroviridis]|uniref:(spotted green pufferfish) hypothetical protein n=1 Tax=Tetraodon nigroviridis TaxID=99883 RepID=Q4SK95_TETNG|nr:unnamed protein product [Tetraodon nigroviridis]